MERRALRWHARRIGFGTVRGRLHDLGGYPGLAISWHVSGGAQGEVWRIIDGRPLWPVLDAYEGLAQTPPEYAREMVMVRLESGLEVSAWVYRPLSDLSEAPRVPRGRWRV